MQNTVRWQTKSGTPMQLGELTITPQSQALTVQCPFGGFVWNRPSGVLVEENGRITHHPIHDVTRTAVCALWAITIVMSLLTLLITISPFRNSTHRNTPSK